MAEKENATTKTSETRNVIRSTENPEFQRQNRQKQRTVWCTLRPWILLHKLYIGVNHVLDKILERGHVIGKVMFLKKSENFKETRATPTRKPTFGFQPNLLLAFAESP